MQYNSNTLSQMNLKNIILSSALALLFIFNSSNALALDFTLLTDIHVTPGNENEKQLIAAIDEINNNSSSSISSGMLRRKVRDNARRSEDKRCDTAHIRLRVCIMQDEEGVSHTDNIRVRCCRSCASLSYI